MFKYKTLTEAGSELPTTGDMAVYRHKYSGGNDDDSTCEEPRAKRFYHQDTHALRSNSKTTGISTKSETGLYLHSSVAAGVTPTNPASHLEQSRLHTVLQKITHKRSQKHQRVDRGRIAHRVSQQQQQQQHNISHIDKENGDYGSMNSLHSSDHSNSCMSSCSLSGVIAEDNFDNDSQKELLLHNSTPTDEPLPNTHRHGYNKDTRQQHTHYKTSGGKNGGGRRLSNLLKDRNGSFGSDGRIDRHPVHWWTGQECQFGQHEVDRISL